MNHNSYIFFVALHHTKSMNLTYFIVAIVIVVLVGMLQVGIMVDYNLLLNIGTIKLQLFGWLTVFSSKVSIIGDYLNFSNEKAKVIKIKLDLNDISLQFFNELGTYLKNKLVPLHLNTNLELCLEHPLWVSIISGLFQGIGGVLEQKFSQNNQLTTNFKVTSGFRHNILILHAKFTFFITLYDLIWSIIRSIIVVRRKHEKQPTKQRKQEGTNH